MSSANKTVNIELNQWQGNEYPKRQDFVDDNVKIDTEIGNLKKDLSSHRAEIVTVATPNKILKLDNNAKYPFSVLDTTQISLKTTQDITYYVANSGNDSTGDGSQTKPFKTIQYTINNLPQIINHDVIINLSPGTYSEDVIIDGFIGMGSIKITGSTDLSGSLNYNINSIKIKVSVRTLISGLNLTSITTFGIWLTSSNVNNLIQNCRCVTNSKSNAIDGFYIENSSVQIKNCEISNRESAIYGSMGWIFSNNNIGTGSNIGLKSTNSSKIGKYGTQPSGTTAEVTSGGGIIG